MIQDKLNSNIIRKVVIKNTDSDSGAKLVTIGETLKELGIEYTKLVQFLKDYSDVVEVQYDKSFSPPVAYAKLKDLSTEDSTISVWHPINFSDDWGKCNTIKLDGILPSWTRKREILKEDSDEYKNFITKLKRQHAIETGIVERLYDLKEGITETFIKDGFEEAFLRIGDTNIPPDQLMAYLKDNFEAINFVFDVVKNDRAITVGFIKEIHHLITSHQETAEGRDQFGNRLQIELLKGQFKVRENNPTRSDGTKFIYCPPVHVASEMDNLIVIYQDLLSRQINPLIIAAWFHHAFTQIHPFQDGNGRVARLMASLILVKHNLFPFTVKRNEKPRYIDALEWADFGLPQQLVDFFCDTQKRNIETALNLQLDLVLSTSSFTEVADIFVKKIENKKLSNEKTRLKLIETNRLEVFNLCRISINSIKTDLEKRLNGNARIMVENNSPGNEAKQHYFSHQIVAFAIKYDYFFNRTLPRAWFRLVIELMERRYELIISLHHYGYDESTFAIAGILQYKEPSREGMKDDDLTTMLPLSIEPYTISLEMPTNQIQKSSNDIQTFLQNVITLTLAQIASEIN